MCMGVLFACAPVYHMDVWCPWIPQGLELWTVWLLGIELESSGKETQLFTAEPTLRPQSGLLSGAGLGR